MTRPVPRRPGLFIAGTDTGVGKTAVAAALLRHASDAGHRLIPFKPAETGCQPHPVDAFQLWEASRAAVPRELVCLYALPLPAAPLLAARHSGTPILPQAIIQRADQLGAAGDGLLVEAAGGLLAPYAPGLTGADLAAQLRLAVLLVGRMALGTINHVALSIAEIRRRDLPLAGLVLVETTADRAPHEDGNAALITEITGMRPLFTFPYIPPPHDADRLASALATAAGPATLRDLLSLASPAANRG